MLEKKIGGECVVREVRRALRIRGELGKLRGAVWSLKSALVVEGLTATARQNWAYLWNARDVCYQFGRAIIHSRPEAAAMLRRTQEFGPSSTITAVHGSAVMCSTAWLACDNCLAIKTTKTPHATTLVQWFKHAACPAEAAVLRPPAALFLAFPDIGQLWEIRSTTPAHSLAVATFLYCTHSLALAHL